MEFMHVDPKLYLLTLIVVPVQTHSKILILYSPTFCDVIVPVYIFMLIFIVFFAFLNINIL